MSMSGDQVVTLKMLLADYPEAVALKDGRVRSDKVAFDFAPEKVAHEAFKRLVRGMEFDLGELAIVTFLQARDHGIPLVLAPAVVVGRFHHDGIGYNPAHGDLTPEKLAGRRIGVRAYTQTTGAWVRGILQNDYGVDMDGVTHVTFEDAHVAAYVEPSNVERAPEDKSLVNMLLDGDIDAGIIGTDLPKWPQLKTLIPDPKAAAAQWYAKHKLVPINHMLVVKKELSEQRPDLVRETFRLLKESKGFAPSGEIDLKPFGVEQNRRSLELIIEYALQQKLISRRFEVDELFDDTTRNLI